MVEHLETSTAIKHRLRRWDGVGPYQIFLRQTRAYRDAMLKAAELGAPPPIAHQRGFVLTDLGLGLVVQKIRDRSGRRAPTLHELAEAGGLDAAIVRDLDRFAHEVRAFRIIINDLDARNLVHESRHGRSRFVLVDGYGSRALVPLRRWSQRINDLFLSRHLQKLAGEVGLRWDRDSWSFNRPDPTGSRDVPHD